MNTIYRLPLFSFLEIDISIGFVGSCANNCFFGKVVGIGFWLVHRSSSFYNLRDVYQVQSIAQAE